MTVNLNGPDQGAACNALSRPHRQEMAFESLNFLPVHGARVIGAACHQREFELDRDGEGVVDPARRGESLAQLHQDVTPQRARNPLQ